MSIWKDQMSGKKDIPSPIADTLNSSSTAAVAHPSTSTHSPVSHHSNHRPVEREMKESLIAPDLTIEGKIEGTGHVRIAGKFKGDVNVQGDLTIEHGARLTGGVKANKVIIAGEMEGNIEGAKQVELLASAALTGDVKCGMMTVATGARMRGQADFGWDSNSDRKVVKDALNT